MHHAGKKTPVHCEEVFEDGVTAFEDGHFEQAAEYFESCQEETHDPEETHWYLTQCYLSLTQASLDRNEEPAAAAWLEKALILNPDFPYLHVVAAHLYRRLKRPAIANRHLTRAIELDPDNAEAQALSVDKDFVAELLS
ncbi:MAG TPA: hypothetical protein VG944_02375 [Fimbriimonas sp.]|nr:hypothetical protein [Fimbriimonas sp.]